MAVAFPIPPLASGPGAGRVNGAGHIYVPMYVSSRIEGGLTCYPRSLAD